MKQRNTSGGDRAETLNRQKRLVLAVMLLLFGVFGFLDAVFASTPGWPKTLFILEALSFSLCLLLWCGSDAELRGFRLTGGLRVTIVLLALIGFPTYAFKSRGRGGWALLGIGLVFVLLLMAAAAAGGLLVGGSGGTSG